jgi:outer membrane protein
MKMLRIVVFLSATFILTILGSSNLFAKELKIAFIDVSVIFEKYEKAKNATKALNKELEKIKRHLQEQEKKIKSMEENLIMAPISATERLKREQSIKEKIEELRTFAEEQRNKILKKEQTLIQELAEEIKNAVKEVAKRHQIDIVLRKDSEAFIYGKKKFDITYEVLSILNKKK